MSPLCIHLYPRSLEHQTLEAAQPGGVDREIFRSDEHLGHQKPIQKNTFGVQI